MDFAVFDAMGHGLGAAQLAHLAVSSYRNSRRSGLGLAATCEAMDSAVASATREGEHFVTCLMGRLDLLTGDLTWANLGHPLPLLVRDGEVVGSLFCEPTLPAGLGPDLVAREAMKIAHDVLRPGDRIFCMTDGVVDGHRRGGEDFGEERLRSPWRQRQSSPERI